MMGDGSSGRYVEESLCIAIVSAVAEREGVERRELTEPLAHTVDLEALAALFRNGSGIVTFDYRGYLVTVDHEHNVEVVAPEDRRR